MWTRALSISFIGFIVWVISAANNGAELMLFKFVAAIPFGDKIGHFLIFLLITICTNIVINAKQVFIYGKHYSLAFLLIGLLATSEEFSQIFIASRSFDWIDLTASLGGVWCGAKLKSAQKQENL